MFGGIFDTTFLVQSVRKYWRLKHFDLYHFPHEVAIRIKCFSLTAVLSCDVGLKSGRKSFQMKLNRL